MNASAATSIASLVDANMKASALVRAAPFVNRLRVADRAANEQEEEAKPSSMASPSCGGVPEPSRFAASRRETNTWMPAEIA